MLPQQDIDSIIHASRACDEGPTQLARRIESAVEAAERERYLIGYREIAGASDLQMRDGDFAREVAARMLGA